VPELPEVETVRRDLDRALAGKRIKAVEVTGARTVRRSSEQGLVDGLTGRTVKGVKRKGKYLVANLDDGRWLVIHLRMSGQLLQATAKEPRPKHTHVVLVLQQGGEIRFVDPRTFGEVFVARPDHLGEDAPDLAGLGWDPIEDLTTLPEFARLMLGRRVQLKALLTDQKVVAGLGNIYGDEILHEAGLRYDRPSDTLTSQELRRLFRAILDVMHEAIAARGSSLADEQYVDLDGKPGRYQHHHRVHAREGKACPRCRATIERVKYQGRSTYYCPNCQV
jgi:formamidopyrimidine-DNA glycosylase